MSLSARARRTVVSGWHMPVGMPGGVHGNLAVKGQSCLCRCRVPRLVIIVASCVV